MKNGCAKRLSGSSEDGSRSEKFSCWTKILLHGQSTKVREYIGAFKAAAGAREVIIDPESDLGRWLDWATRYADRLDPSSTLKPPRDPWEVAE